jgi:hypothetical protein
MPEYEAAEPLVVEVTYRTLGTFGAAVVQFSTPERHPSCDDDPEVRIEVDRVAVVPAEGVGGENSSGVRLGRFDEGENEVSGGDSANTFSSNHAAKRARAFTDRGRGRAGALLLERRSRHARRYVGVRA